MALDLADGGVATDTGCVSSSGLPAEVKLAIAPGLAAGLALYLTFAGRDEAGRLAAEMTAER